MPILVILPHQLFDIKIIKNVIKKYSIINIIIWEHPHYFLSYNYNKKKLLLHRASMKYYYDYLNTAFKDSNMKSSNVVQYIEFHVQIIDKLSSVYLFDPIDKIKINGITKKAIILESPNFLISTELMKKYRNKTDKFFFHYFYNFHKQELDIIPNIKSKDKFNRRTMSDKINIPKTFPSIISKNTSNMRYITDNIEYINANFPNNYGNTDDFQFPITHKDAKILLKYFIKHKFKLFGPYQDYIDCRIDKKDNEEYSYLFHSVLSTSINIGLINPIDIIKEVIKYKTQTPINSFEGFIRQLFWREYQRYCYIYYDFNNKNYLGNTKKLTSAWYNGTLGIKPVDNCIKKAFRTGYLHHIERLMVVGNYMNLSEIRPSDGFRWFMEFSCDSYEWVMHQNVYDMVFFVSGGATMRRPYISSSNYILKMSNYKCTDDKWCNIWNDKYRHFIKKHYSKLKHSGFYIN